MGANSGYMRICEPANVGLRFAIISDDSLYDRIVDGPLNVRNDKDFVTHGLVSFGGSDSREIDVVIPFMFRLAHFHFRWIVIYLVDRQELCHFGEGET